MKKIGKNFIKKIKILLIIFLLILSKNAFSNNKYVKKSECMYVGIITGDRINIRRASNISSEIIGVLNKNDKVYVIEQKEDWISIKLPETISLWVNSKFIKKKGSKGIILKDGVNVRVRPNTKYSVICQVFKGDEVSIIDKDIDWLKIQAPEETVGWIHQDYLKYFLSVEEYSKALEKEKKSKTELEKSKYKFILEKSAIREMAEIEKSWNEKINDKEYDINNFKKTYQDFIEKYPDMDVTNLAKERLNFLNKADTIILHQNLPLENGICVEKRLSGVIYDLGVLINRPGTHKLLKDGKLICLLKSNTYDLNEYIYQKVNIDGVLKTVKGWDIPLLEVKKIKKISWKGRM